MTRLSAPRQKRMRLKDSMRGQVKRYLVESLLLLRESEESVRDDSIRTGW
jgi:hypothetical protein